MQTTVPKRSQGFTLVEMVVAIVVSAILAAAIVSYIGDSVEGFSSSANRNRLASSGRTVLDRMALELHNAVPNSVRVTPAQSDGGQCLEMIPFLGATTYLNAPFEEDADQFEIIELHPPLRMETPDDIDQDHLYAILYPINTDALYAGIANGSPGPIVEVAKLRDTYDNDATPPAVVDACTDDLLTLDDDGAGKSTLCFADGEDVDTDPDLFRFSLRSPEQRLYIATQPVSFCVVDDRIYRYSGYGFHATQCNPDTAACLPDNAADGRSLVTDRVDNSGLAAFTLVEQSLRRNAIISLNLNFSDQGDVVELKHEVLMRNVP